MKSKTKSSKPPSKIKYLKNNPSITFNVPIEILHEIDEMCKTKGVTKSQFLKSYYIDQVTAFDDIKAKHAAEIENMKKETFENGYQKGSSDKERTLKQEYDKNIESVIKTKFESKLKSERDKAYDEGQLEGKVEQNKIMKEQNKIHLKCFICEKPLSLDITNINDRKVITNLTKNSVRHGTCVKKY